MGVLLGLTAALAWGVGDFFAARLSRIVGTRRAPLYTQSLGVGISTLLVQLLAGRLPNASARDWLLMIALGVMHALATIWFYRALEVGKISLTTPIMSSCAVVTAILMFLSGERPAKLTLCGAALLILGLVFVTAGHKGEKVESELGGELGDEVSTRLEASTRRGGGVLEAVGAAIAFGITFWGLDFLEPRFGGPWLLLMLRVVTLPVLAALFFASRRMASAPVAVEAKGLLWLCAIAVISCDTAAWLAISYGRRMEDMAIVTTLASLYSGVTIFLAWLLWRERLQRQQWLGVAIILSGIVLVGVT